MGASEVTNFLEEIYRQELEDYQRLLRLSYKQQELIKEEELEKLEELLQKKEELMSSIDGLEERLAPYKEVIIKKFNLNDNKWLVELLETKLATNRLKGSIKNLVDILKELSQLDRKNQELISTKRADLFKELNLVKKGSKINNSYNSRVRIHSTFIDDKS